MWPPRLPERVNHIPCILGSPEPLSLPLIVLLLVVVLDFLVRIPCPHGSPQVRPPAECSRQSRCCGVPPPVGYAETSPGRAGFIPASSSRHEPGFAPMDLRDLRAFLCKLFSPGLPVGSDLVPVLVLRPRHPMNENEVKGRRREEWTTQLVGLRRSLVRRIMSCAHRLVTAQNHLA